MPNNRVNIWPQDEAFRRVLEALMIFKDTHGSFSLTNLLQQEIARETVVREYHAGNKALAEERERLAAEYEGRLGATLAALEFYADPANYKPHAHSKPSAVFKDAGRQAREAIEAISGEAEDDDGFAEAE